MALAQVLGSVSVGKSTQGIWSVREGLAVSDLSCVSLFFFFLNVLKHAL